MPTREVPVTRLYDDVLLDIFTRTVENADEHLDEVQMSGWDIAPSDRPPQFKNKGFLTGTPTTPQYDDDTVGEVEVRDEVTDWPPGAQEVAKAIQEAFGVEGEKFTQADVVNLDGSFKKGSVRNYFNQHFKPDGYIDEAGKDGNAKVWMWIKSIRKEDV